MAYETKKGRKSDTAANPGGAADNPLANYKGEFYQDQDTKYQDPVTGAHFNYKDMCMRLCALQQQLCPQNVLEVEADDPAANLQTEPPDCAPLEDPSNAFLFRTQETAGPQPGVNPMTSRRTNPVDFLKIQRLASLLGSTLQGRHGRQTSCPEGKPARVAWDSKEPKPHRVSKVTPNVGFLTRAAKEKPKIRIAGKANKFLAKGSGPRISEQCFESPAAFFSSLYQRSRYSFC